MRAERAQQQIQQTHQEELQAANMRAESAQQQVQQLQEQVIQNLNTCKDLASIL